VACLVKVGSRQVLGTDISATVGRLLAIDRGRGFEGGQATKIENLNL